MSGIPLVALYVYTDIKIFKNLLGLIGDSELSLLFSNFIISLKFEFREFIKLSFGFTPFWFHYH